MNASCEVFQETISARFDREEQAISDSLIDAHLATCASCRAYAAGLEALSRRLGLGLASWVALVKSGVDPLVVPNGQHYADLRSARHCRCRGAVRTAVRPTCCFPVLPA
jgi:hypothetical protein